MNELVVISGKGGMGGTSVTASFAVLADRPVIADGDVDAADLHMVLSPRIHGRPTRHFAASPTAEIMRKILRPLVALKSNDPAGIRTKSINTL